jgi:guanylate kinase
MELAQEPFFEYRVVNDDLQTAIDEVDGIVRRNIDIKRIENKLT